MRIRKFVYILIAAAPLPAYAGQTGPGIISDLQINANRVLFRVGGTSSGKPACATESRYVIDLAATNGTSLLAYLLTAQSTGKDVLVYGTGTCSILSDHETTTNLRDGS